MSPFKTHCKNSAKSFLQTALVIDDEPIVAKPPTATGTPDSSGTPPMMDAPTGSILFPSKAATESATEAPAPVDPGGSKAVPSSGLVSHTLRFKELSDAFLKESVICGLFQPTSSEGIVDLSTDAACLADVVVVDWFLAEKTSANAKAIIAGILESDLEENGRLRLIAVYTSQPGRLGMAKDLHAAIDGYPRLKGRLQLHETDVVLIGRDVRICFLNKPNTFLALPADIVREEDLPDRLTTEFSAMTCGLLPSFAVSAIASIRSATHHILSVFRKELDGAYVGHRCALETPEDAKDFALRLIGSELENALSTNEIAEKSLDSTVISMWIDDMTAEGHRFKIEADAMAMPDLVKEFVAGGLDVIEGSAARQVRADDGEPLAKKAPKIKPESVTQIFYSSDQEAWARSIDFSRLVAFKREAEGRSRYPASWRPTLTLGSVLRVMEPPPATAHSGQPAGPNPGTVKLPDEHLMCVQPRCDSVRLEGPLSFPFQRAPLASKKFNLIVSSGDSDVRLLVGHKPSQSVNIDFAPENPSKTVRAKVIDGKFVFTDTLGRHYLWLGDLADMKALSFASDLASRMHGVGFDEYEILRRGAKGEIIAAEPDSGLAS